MKNGSINLNLSIPRCAKHRPTKGRVSIQTVQPSLTKQVGNIKSTNSGTKIFKLLKDEVTNNFLLFERRSSFYSYF